VRDVIDRVNNAVREVPKAEDVLADPVALADALSRSIESGETSVKLNVTATEDEIRNMSENLDPFWGKPDSYLITDEWEDVRLTSTGSAVTVHAVEFALEQSVSYYAYQAYVAAYGESGAGTSGQAGAEPGDSADADAFAGTGAAAPKPPADIESNVKAVTNALPTIVASIEASLKNTSGTDYDKALAVHDWLVGNIEYDDTIYEGSPDNGVFGALIGRKTMCQGYAEAFELLLRLISDADVHLEVGEGKSSESSGWIDHAWNVVELDGAWYQIDATFDDPVNSERKGASHQYFGRSDAGIKPDHRWNAEFWPAAANDDFLYYHEEGLYAKSKKKMRKIVKKLLADEPADIEVAVEGVKLKEKDLQFIYDADDDVENILYSFTDAGEEVTILNLQLSY
jgi:hypothetical protein